MTATASLTESSKRSSTTVVLFALLAIIAGTIFLAAVTGIVSYAKWHDYANKAEVGLVTAIENQKSHRAENFNKIQELVQVPAMYVKDLSKAFNSAIEARYGQEGSKAVFQVLSESNPNLSPEMYSQIMRVVEASRNQNANDQTEILDRKGGYQTNIGNLWSGFWIHTAGYPKIDLNAIKAISTEKVNQELETHISTPLQLQAQ